MKESQNFTSSNNKNLLVVLPINKLEDFFLKESVYSLTQQEYPIDLLILVNKLTENEISELQVILDNPSITISERDKVTDEIVVRTIEASKKLNYTIQQTDNDTFQKVFNEGFNYALTNGYKWISIVEYDDVIDVKWYENFNKYSNHLNDVSGFLPLTREMSNGTFLGFFNEASWIDGAETPGYFDYQRILQWNCINITGAVLNVEFLINESINEKKEDGSWSILKPSLKYNFIYEFYIRMIYNEAKFYTIPRIGYEHRIDRVTENVDYFSSKIPKDLLQRPAEKGGVTYNEYEYYTLLAKQEYFHENDRGLIYSQE